MNKDDYIRELDNITAPEGLKAKIKSAHTAKKKSSVPKRIIAVAACLVVVAVAVFNLIPSINGVTKNSASSLFNSRNDEAVADDNGAYISESSASGSTAQSTGIDITGAVAAKQSTAVQSAGGKADMVSPYKTDKDKIAVSRVCVIRGKVESTQYVLDGSTVLTKSKVIIEESFKGELKAGDEIYVRELGGFVPSDVLNDAISKEKFGISGNTDSDLQIVDVRIENFKVMEKDEEVILFIIPIDNASDEFDGCYDLLRLWQGKLLFDSSCGAYVPYVPEYELSSDIKDDSAKIRIKCNGQNPDGVQARIYTLDEFREFINQNK
ncbi:MAG: hypothetical protein ACI4RB_04450 [Acutalibacteraceae bacterium]